ncbi:OmpA-OmpF porin, OOP family [Mucilaginibacter mallensis]|uniref:OmpA-OmpF porin, OOP family n=1 Tax=Mucilaginibacter mallensis TaxID=652787 RepID=A0A1H1N7M4_MUCMA|nr:OmpA family protein [Mucilaginibacter mallensis]SDR94725.1 OmpA-OmpF porin, OOP family [Mucilaginibacter mallensis]
MNYSTLKKTVALSVVSLMALGAAKAQTSTDSTKTVSSATSSAKVFGGLGQYNHISIGINAGMLSGQTPLGNNVTTHFTPELGYGVSIRDAFSHFFSLSLDYLGGTVKGNNDGYQYGPSKFGGIDYKTKTNAVSLNAIVNFGSVSFLHRANAVNFYGDAGYGLDFYKPKFDLAGGTEGAFANVYSNTVKEVVVPVGVGVKFKLSDALALNFGYKVNFIGGYNFAGYHSYPTQNRYSYSYGGLEYTFGSSAKKNIDWVNPIAMMYDELYDAALRQEVEALKGRVTNVETAVADLKKDSDGDGVSDQFDKCPNTPAGSVVDGSGCVIVFPKDTTKKDSVKAAPYSNIQFEFDSSVLRTSSYPVLDATSADLRATGKTLTVAGYASSEGTAAHNMRLSKDRANSVKTYLVNSGVDAKHLKIKAFGETHPIADNSTEEGRVANRRVEFHQ